MEAEHVSGKYICKACRKSLRYRPSVEGYTCSNKNCENYRGKWRRNVFRLDEECQSLIHNSMLFQSQSKGFYTIR